MGRNRPRICVSVVNNDVEAIKAVARLVDLFEVRIDLINQGWQKLTRNLEKPWIACNRRTEEGGSWKGNESERIDQLMHAIELGAGTVDIELNTPDIHKVVKQVKGRVKCLLSYHDLNGTPSLEKMRDIVKKELVAGADICKVVSTARSFADNLAVLQLISDFPEITMVAFAMGDTGQISRILCPFVGGYFTYASIEVGRESGPGQITARDLRKIYRMLKDGQ